ncbi:MAG: CapA family protein [Novosphingobium sp.]|nr:CapA family protein [Novosphingobium sp.]
MLAGDVMLGRGIDQIQPFPAPSAIHEHYCRSACDYIALAERRNGPIPRGVAPEYIWGDALAEIEAHAPDLRIVNLETAVTLSEQYLPKGINYRMNPANLPCLSVAGIDCCVLANNHVLDWGEEGLAETLDVLAKAGFALAGAGHEEREAAEPAILPCGGGRLVVHAVACPSAGVPPEWAAGAGRPGVHVVSGRLDASAYRLAERIAQDRRTGDIVAVSIHRGGNWGYEIEVQERAFAHFLIAEAGADVVHGHSSHHPRGVEIYRDRAILYGCGDLINDYEGIHGHESFRPDLVLAPLLSLLPDGTFATLEMLPYRLERFRLNRASVEERQWLAETLNLECRRLGTGMTLAPDGRLLLARP